MYPSKGSNNYGQQSYPGQQSYAQVPGTGFSQGQSSAIGANQEADVSGYRSYHSQAAQYSGPYAALYGAAALSAAQQAGGVGGKVTVPSGVQERMSYPSTLPPESSKFSSGALGSNLGMNSDDYVSASNCGYAQKGDQFSAVKSSEYASTERRQYGDQAAYLGRELQSDSSRRYADPAPLNQLHQTDMHGQVIEASLLRQQQMVKAQALQSGTDMRLSISPGCSKVVLHWPKESLHLSLHTPVSFEHEVVEVDNKSEKGSDPLDDLSRLTRGSTVWNAKVILMSGISAGALNDMSSYKSSDEKILHFNNILRFAILRKDRTFMAIGGPWDPTIDGGDPSTMDSSLIQTACRYVRDTTQLDLQKCQNWNRFLEIHYDRVGNDGLFSHKEITVLFVPDLSECLPSLDSWRSQWFAHKKDVADRERLLAAKQEKKSTEKKDSAIEKAKAKEDTNVSKSGTDVPVLGKETDKEKAEGTNTIKMSKKNGVEQKGKETVVDTKQTEAAVKGEVKEEGKIDSKKATEGAAVDPSVNVQKSGKKKVVKKVVKGKVASKKAVAQNVESTPTSKEKPVAEMVNQDEEKIAKIEPVETSSSQGKVVKTTGKKKIIRRVIKRKVSGTEVKAVTAIKKETTEISDNAAVAVHKAKEGEEIKEEIETKNAAVAVISKDKTTDEPKKVVAEKENKDEKKPKAEKEGSKDGVSDDQNSKSEKRGSKSSAEAKPESKPKLLKEVKEKVKPEEPPEQPGLFLQTKRSKESRIRTMSLSLDGLLDYNDKDIEESTFELSVFAESLNEMLQYQMGCRLLSFLKKLRRKFILSKNQRKRLRDDKTEKESEKESSAKRPKVIDDSVVENESKESGTKDASKKNPDDSMCEDGSAAGEDGSKTENKSVDGTYNDVDNDDEEDIEEEEDPEEIIEDDQEMEDVSASDNGVQEYGGNVAKSATESEKPTIEVNNGEKSIDVMSNKNHEKEDDKQSETVKTDSGKEVVVHEEVLQAFRYFDRNRVGYIKVEDLRCLIHNLGKFLSHRDVKEMIQSALFESNSARDNRIFYKKLVRLTDI